MKCLCQLFAAAWADHAHVPALSAAAISGRFQLPHDRPSMQLSRRLQLLFRTTLLIALYAASMTSLQLLYDSMLSHSLKTALAPDQPAPHGSQGRMLQASATGGCFVEWPIQRLCFSYDRPTAKLRARL